MSDAEQMCLTEFDEWQAGLRARAEQTARRRAAKDDFRRAQAARRAHGLVARYAARTAATSSVEYPFPPDPVCSE
ncbi:hypothetical protein [Actinoplanes sp. NPDC051494]|uniref:hypothetical protein n=1 Tax=Actinoplanes sp. NPDC051494 TaxID=3363907 RepID=UPI003788BB19